VQERLGIAGSGTIATGLAACATRTNGHLLWARSEASAQRATKAIAKARAASSNSRGRRSGRTPSM